ncbi:unnamed protein product [Soboliphyme baturini]|uniref:protein-L-isoaspartate(D-aspartate) O-methyltransferase n=1 Tax=Soboliphyme baturini TaxID=241478 RepID=A0A183IYC2_9BILA|nr:unnamed protein product [Soboliphyme baturini]
MIDVLILRIPSFVLLLMLVIQKVVCLLAFRAVCSMAWISHGVNNTDMVQALKRNGIITSDRVENAMLAVDRGNYSLRNPYYDSPQGIGYGATISAPHMVIVFATLHYTPPGSVGNVLTVELKNDCTHKMEPFAHC